MLIQETLNIVNVISQSLLVPLNSLRYLTLNIALTGTVFWAKLRIQVNNKALIIKYLPASFYIYCFNAWMVLNINYKLLVSLLWNIQMWADEVVRFHRVAVLKTLQNNFFEKFCKIHRKIPTMEPPFSKAASQRSQLYLKRTPW